VKPYNRHLDTCRVSPIMAARTLSDLLACDHDPDDRKALGYLCDNVLCMATFLLGDGIEVPARDEILCPKCRTPDPIPFFFVQAILN
jgi:hypothetical protein